MKNNFVLNTAEGSFRSSGNRLFKRSNPKDILISWIDKRCSVCGRFVSKRNSHKRCNNCFKEYRKEQDKKYFKANFLKKREYIREYMRRYRRLKNERQK